MALIHCNDGCLALGYDDEHHIPWASVLDISCQNEL